SGVREVIRQGDSEFRFVLDPPGAENPLRVPGAVGQEPVDLIVRVDEGRAEVPEAFGLDPTAPVWLLRTNDDVDWTFVINEAAPRGEVLPALHAGLLAVTLLRRGSVELPEAGMAVFGAAIKEYFRGAELIVHAVWDGLDGASEPATAVGAV